MIETRYNLELTINNTPFLLSVREPNKEERTRLKKLADSEMEAFNEALKEEQKSRAIELEIEEKEGIYQINQALIQEGSVREKLPLWLENKRLLQELKPLRLALAGLKKPLPNLEESLERVMRHKVELLCEGELEKLKAHMEREGVSFYALWKEIESLVQEAQQKKSKS